MNKNPKSKVNNCATCGKQFPKPTLLRRHEVVHTKQKEFACTSCPSHFSQQSSLLRHMRNKHATPLPNITNQTAAHEDADEMVAQHALAALKELQCGMNPALSSPNQTDVTQATLADKQPSNLTQLRDKLHAAGETEVTATQAIERKPKKCYYVCEYCAKEFSKTYDLIRHRRSHTKEKPYGCNHCIKRFSTKSKLNEHVKRMHTANKRHACSYCIASYRSKRALTLHLTEQHKNVLYICETCGRSFKSKTAYDAHQKLEADKDLMGLKELLPNPLEHARCYKCVYCAKIFTRKSNCRNHMLTHLRRLLNEEPQAQATSSKGVSVFRLVSTTSSIDSVNYELRLLPAKTCEYCDKSFQKPSDLSRHLRTHTGTKPHSCHECQKSFALKSTLERHLRTHQQQRNMINCQVCGKSYASKTALKVHLRLHTGARPFKCEVCAQTFRTSGHRLQHMRAGRHKGIKNALI